MEHDASVRRDLPTGTVTFLFTDIEGSTRLLQALGRDYAGLLERHANIMRRALAAHDGVVVGTEGDSFFAVFRTAARAVEATAAAQRELAGEHWPGGHRVFVRMGMHTGEGTLGLDGYVGLAVHLAARVAAAGHGGQVLMTDATRVVLDHALPGGVALRDLGPHRLKDIDEPEHLYQLVIEGLSADFPPIRTLDARQTNLPAARTSFVGRRRELAELLELIGSTRLLTLTGPGGTGKTRLALEVTDRALDRYTDGAYFVDLSPLTDHRFVPGAIAEALRLRQQPARRPLDTVVDHLSGRHMLLVLDNLEHLIDCAETVGILLDAAPRLTVLATSRVPLRIYGEQEYPVSPLPLPAPDTTDRQGLERNEAVRLFLERATAVRPGFGLSPENAPAIGQIAVRLDGLPLAIELAAGRVKLMEPDAILARLSARLDLLIGGTRDLPARQRTLRAAIEWSHDLLEPDAQRLFARLAVFSGGWSLDAAEPVCAAGLGSAVLDDLASLLDHSLISRVEQSDETRFVMLETIHEFASGRLADSGESDQVRRRHAEYFLDLAENPRPLARAATLDPGASLDIERDNLRAALSWALAAGEAELGLRIASAVWPMWPRRDIAEGRAWLEQFLTVTGGAQRDAARARALTSLGGIAVFQNDLETARASIEEAVAIARELGDARVLAYAIDPLEVLLRAGGELDAAEALLEEGLRVANDTGEAAIAAEFTGRIGFVQVFKGDPSAAISPLRHAIAVLNETGETTKVTWYKASLGTAELLAGDLSTAEREFRDVVVRSHAAGDLPALGAAILGLGFVASGDGQHERVARLWGVAARLRRDAGGGPVPAILQRVGDPEGAAQQALGDICFKQRHGEGEQMSMSEAVAYALAEEDSHA